MDPAAPVTPESAIDERFFLKVDSAESGRRGKERERIHRITNELRDSIKHLLYALLRAAAEEQKRRGAERRDGE